MGRLSPMDMADVHTHTLLSDGVFVPEELVRRVEVVGYKYLAVTDHVGISTVETVVSQLVIMCRSLSGFGPVKVVPGAEVTHVRPELIGEAVRLARRFGAKVVVGHGETISESVAPGSNRAFIEAGVDVLAHPGLISLEVAKLAEKYGVRLEISARKGHSFTNGHVLNMARAAGATISFGSDGHDVSDYPTRAKAELIARGAGMTDAEILKMFEDNAALVENALRKKSRGKRKER